MHFRRSTHLLSDYCQWCNNQAIKHYYFCISSNILRSLLHYILVVCSQILGVVSQTPKYDQIIRLKLTKENFNRNQSDWSIYLSCNWWTLYLSKLAAIGPKFKSWKLDWRKNHTFRIRSNLTSLPNPYLWWLQKIWITRSIQCIHQ